MITPHSWKSIALFVGGTLFGSAGFKLLSSQDAKKVYVHTTAAALRAKESVMTTVNQVQEQAGDIFAEAKDLNARRAEDAAVKTVEDAAQEAEAE